MNEMDLIHAFKSMLMVAREYELKIDEKYEELENILLEEYDLEVVHTVDHDMMDSMENVYQLLNK
ncbi:hypothetical protein SFC27_10860 [Bacillus licheniformis]|uniref:Uncharacterized protein n=1 Tax=Bacillus licheniformis TaxID=1402 RepID=A0A5Q3BQC0_BACLI|nr:MULTISPECIES: hypothetical protein [Bacillus]AMR12736.1 hypothetical protein AB684_11485 [Bacillus licheniformis]ARC58747.1 hypothetical protein BaDB11_00078 [Bacillus licheniformis]ARC67856.1 hypothetical protein B34_00413 [Bacillus licheniformis]AVI45369.1 hypothetical protein BL14DL4_00101 [Bacillus licheniformis]EQM25321.1 hypothetical protein N399_24010 [Bacillus licheniformis CG-B52]